VPRAGVRVPPEDRTGPEVRRLEEREGRRARYGRVEQAERGGGVTRREEELLGQAGGGRVAPAEGGGRGGGGLVLLLELLLSPIGDEDVVVPRGGLMTERAADRRPKPGSEN